jgi:glycosyltransferase involved in cell wall biosynthesis
MSTYNGESYIEEQLQSILRQTRKPDEVILYDDCSADATVSVIQSFITYHGLESQWKLIIGEVNRGYPISFYHAMSLCSGDIVFLSDQDDIWNIRKIEEMYKLFEQYPHSNLISCKFGLINNEGVIIKAFMNPGKSQESEKCRSVNLIKFFGKYQWPGMVLAYRRDWAKSLFQKISIESSEICKLIPHDFLLAAWAAETKTFLQLDETLAYHRRHLNNAAKEEHRISKLLNRERKLWEIQHYNNMLDAMIDGNVLQTLSGRLKINQKREAMKVRLEVIQNGKLSELFCSLWKYRQVIRLEAFICDMIIILKLKVTKKCKNYKR